MKIKSCILLLSLILLLTAGCKNRNNYTNKDLLNAIMKNNFTLIKKIVKNGINLNDNEAIEKSPLYLACMKGNYKIAQFLIDNGANVNIIYENATCKKPLIMAAASTGKIDFVGFLIKNGVDVDAVSNKNRTALIIASCKGYEDIARILLENGAKVNHEFKFANNKKTALIRAGEQGHQGIIKILKKYGATE